MGLAAGHFRSRSDGLPARGPGPGGDTLRKVSLKWPQHRVKLPNRKVARTHFQEDSASSQPGTRPRGGRERRHLIPSKAAGPTSGSLPLPPSAPPPPAKHKAVPEAGARPAGGRRTPLDRGPYPRDSGRAGRRSRAERTRLLALPPRRGKPGPAAPSPPSPPGKARRDPRRPASHARGGGRGGPGLAGACARRPDVGHRRVAGGLSRPHGSAK